MKKIRIKDGHRRDFSTYLRWRREWKHNFNPNPEKLLIKGVDNALQVFVVFESTGQQSEKVKQPRLYKTVLEGKTLLNWQIKQWADGVRDAGYCNIYCAFLSLKELQLYFSWLPTWVWNAVWRQAGYKEKIPDEINT